MLLYGSIDGCQSVYADKQVASKIEALAAKLHWCESSIRLTPKAVESNASAEATIRGMDQNDFIDLCRKAFQGMEVAFS